MPLNVVPFSDDTFKLIQLIKEFESLTVEAAVNGDRHAAHRALILNPLVTTGTVLEKALDETIEANRDHMSSVSLDTHYEKGPLIKDLFNAWYH